MTEQRSAGTRSELGRLAHWDGLLAELATAVTVTDLAGRIVIWNRAATDLFGWPADDVFGRPIFGLLLADHSGLDDVRALTAAASGERWEGDHECRHRDGSRFPAHLSLCAAYDADRSVLGFVCEARDVSDLKAAETKANDTASFFRSLLLNAAEVACVCDEEGCVKYLLQSDGSRLGYLPHELTTINGFDLAHPDDVGELRKAFAEVIVDPALHPKVVYRVQAKSGEWCWREARVTNLLDDPIVGGIVCNIADVTALQETLGELRAAEARQQAIVARSRDATLFFDGDGTIRWASTATTDLLGIAPAQLAGQNGLDFIHPNDQERVLAEFASMTGLGDHVRTEFRVIDPRGDVRWLEEDATNLVDDPDVGYVVGNIRDITERKVAQEQLARLALHDPLTGLPNRTLLIDRLELLLARGGSAAVLYIDIDNFGDVNDTLGHGPGDELLRQIGWRLASSVAELPTTLARVGGDEFVLLCDGVRDATLAVAYAEQLRESLRLPFEVDGQDVYVAASVGVALTPGDASGLLRNAGIATHQAKQQGRDRVTIFDASLDVAQRDRLRLQGELRNALDRAELLVWYQPMIDLETDRIAGVEALVRWDHPTRGILKPSEFIDVAEASGLIRTLGSQVLRRTCADARAWRERGIALRVSVNAAAAQLNSQDFATELEDALEEFGLDPEQMTIEITETTAMQVGDAVETLNRIRQLGFHLALDDFGTGYSSLSFLRELPVDAIKIDRSFVSGLGTNERDTSIVQGVFAIARALGHAVVAEGIETETQADALRQLGCRYAQGFLWSRPVPAADIERMMTGR